MKKRLLLAAALTWFSGYATATGLPDNLDWQTNWDEPLFASPDAQFGGVYRTYIQSFPQTLRSVGPDSNSGLRAFFLDHTPGLVERHPNTAAWIPSLANYWAFAGDNKTMYFRLNPKAQWSDGHPVTADDFVYMLQFYRSRDIVAPWYNEYYTNMIDQIIKIDEHTFAAVSKIERNEEDLLYTLGGLRPRPAHFYANPEVDENGDGVHDNFVRKYNFAAEPTTNAYYLDEVRRGRSVTFNHVGQDWWGYSNKYYQNRYNVEQIRINVIRDNDIAQRHFERGDIDAFPLILPDLWHDKSNSQPYQRGYIEKFWGYNELPQGAGGIWMNVSVPLLDDIRVRKGITYATDFDGLIENVTRGDYVRKPHGMGTGHGKYSLPDATPPAFDVAKAIAYFTAAGFDRLGGDGIRVNQQGQRLSFAITYGAPHHTPRVAYLREQARQAGLELQLNLVDGSSAFKSILEKQHQLAYLTMGTSEVPAYWEYFHSDNANQPQTNNHTNYSSPQLDELIMAYQTEFDIEKKHAFSHQIQRLIGDAYVIVPGYMVPYTRAGYWRWLKYPEPAMTRQTDTLFTTGGALGLGTYWIDLDKQQETQQAMRARKSFEPVVVIDDTFKR